LLFLLTPSDILPLHGVNELGHSCGHGNQGIETDNHFPLARAAFDDAVAGRYSDSSAKIDGAPDAGRWQGHGRADSQMRIWEHDVEGEDLNGEKIAGGVDLALGTPRISITGFQGRPR